MFWGLFFIAVGVLFLVNYVFGIHLPVFRILFALFLIYLGVSFLFGSFGVKLSTKFSATDHVAIFSKSEFEFKESEIGGQKVEESQQEDKRHFQTVFGHSKLDLSARQDLKGQKLRLTTVFGQTRILVKKGTPLWVDSTTVFGSTHLPGENFNAFGEFKYRSPGVTEKAQALNIQTEVVFGELSVKEVD
jgi:predicted membrane protein